MLKSWRCKLAILRRNKGAFLRWAWLRFTGRTAYRFAPLYQTELVSLYEAGSTVYVSTGGAPAIRQANGLILPERSMPATDPTLRADVEAAWDAAYGARRKKLRAVK